MAGSTDVLFGPTDVSVPEHAESAVGTEFFLPYRLRAPPLSDFNHDAHGALKFHLVGINGGADLAGTSGFETSARLGLVWHHEPNVIKPLPLAWRPHRHDSEVIVPSERSMRHLADDGRLSSRMR